LLFLKFFTFSHSLKPLGGRGLRSLYGHGAMVAYGSPKPLIWVRILVPVRSRYCRFQGFKGSKRIKTFRSFEISEPLNFFKLLTMNKFTAYIRDSYKELVHKVTWPNWDQLQQSTMIVLGATLLITAVVWVMDFAANNSMKFIYSLFK
jgi:preprotein translocase subunit SecE